MKKKLFRERRYGTEVKEEKKEVKTKKKTKKGKKKND